MFRQLATHELACSLLSLQDLLFPPAAAATHPGTGEKGRLSIFTGRWVGVGVRGAGEGVWVWGTVNKEALHWLHHQPCEIKFQLSLPIHKWGGWWNCRKCGEPVTPESGYRVGAEAAQHGEL